MTMYRYMALMWSRTDRDAARVAKFLAAKLHEVSPHQWSQTWDGAGLAIYHSGEHKGRMQTYRLQGERGAVLGRLFRNDYTSVVDDLDEFESRKCLETRGQRLIDDYWGRYVAFLNNPETGTRYVMRDPTGAFPCFHTPFRGVTIYFSDMQDAANFDFLPFTVNWEYLKTNIMLPQLRTMHTGLNEVGEIQPGECVEVAPFEKKSQFLWNPTEISQTDVVEDAEEAAALLRETVMKTIGSLAGCYDRVVHHLGGLDSSILLACMAQAPNRPEITCLNYFTKSPGGEERRYSRQVAEKYDVEFVDIELDYRKVDLNKLFSANKLAKPFFSFDGIELTGDAMALADEKGASALIYGSGGDNVLYHPARNYGALDYVRHHGLFGKNALKIAMEASRYGRKSLTRTIRDVLRERFAPEPCYDYVHSERLVGYKIPFINPDFIGVDGHEQYLNPLVVPSEGDLKGKYLHIVDCLLFVNEYYHHYNTRYSVEYLRAYFTQPIIETCLRIPTWVLTYGGVDRGLARKAFQNILPRDIVLRLTKSTPSEFFRDVYEHNSTFLREVLLDGVLEQNGILLRSQLEDVLNRKNLFLKVICSQVLGYAALEAWLRGWLERPLEKPRQLDVGG